MPSSMLPASQPTTEFGDASTFSLHLEENGARIVADKPGQTQLARDSVDEWTEADSLDNTRHGEVLPNFVRSQQQGPRQGEAGHLNRPMG